MMAFRVKHRMQRRPIGGSATTDRTTGAAVAAKAAAKAHRVLPVLDFLKGSDVAATDRAISMAKRRKRSAR